MLKFADDIDLLAYIRKKIFQIKYKYAKNKKKKKQNFNIPLRGNRIEQV